MKSVAMLFGLALTFASAGAQSQISYNWIGGPLGGIPARDIPSTREIPTAQHMRLKQQQIALLRLRYEALQQQTRDGGTLTPEHRAHFQARLDAIRARAQ